MAYAHEERVIVPEYHFVSRLVYAVPEAFNNACPERDVRNKRTLHRLVAKLRGTRGVFCD
jgi:hypothetical protein